jgi:4-amino-4-deoxy-L-arabinose transferase-like glycosyltransferase
VFFSIPVGKRNVYLLPLYPAMAAALAPFFLEAWDGLHERLARASAALLAIAAAGSCVLLWVGAGHVPAEIAAGSRVYLGICLLALVAAAGVPFARFRVPRGRVVVAVTIGFVWLLVLASGLLLPILGRFMPVPRLAAALVARAGPEDLALVYRTSIHSLMFYANRRTSTVQDPAQLLQFVSEGKRAFVLGADEKLEELRALPSWTIAEIDRAPYFKFNFERNIRGLGPSALDLVLVEVRRATPDERRAREARDDAARSPGSK